MDFSIIIPARYDSQRLPGKVLLNVAGKPLIQHVYGLAQKTGCENIVIATDDDRIAEVAEGFGAAVCMTSADHQSGSERIAEAVVALEMEDDEVVIGLQADEPLIVPSVIRELAEHIYEHDNIKVASVCHPIEEVDDLFDPHCTKVVLSRRNYALYFSRAPIPWERNSFSNREQINLTGKHYRHIGIYGYRVDFLQHYIEWEPCSIEEMECLEQLRILWHGGRIHMLVTKHNVHSGVDTEADLARVEQLLKKR